VTRCPPPSSCAFRRHSHSCGEMSNRPLHPPSGRSWGQARGSYPPTSPSHWQATQAKDALNQELPAGLQTLAIDVNKSHSCCGMIKGPHAPQWTTLGSGPQGRFSHPSWSGPGYPQPGEAHRARAEVAHRPSVSLGKLRVNRVSSQRQFPVWLTGRQCTCTTRHPSQLRVSTPWLTGPQYPMPALSAARPLGPSLQRTFKSASVDMRVA
jgi:hypothetical protein